jgi:hypothetical protein
VIGDLTKTSIELRARDIRWRLLQVLNDAAELSGDLAAATASGALTAPDGPYPGGDPDLANVTGMADRYAQLGRVFHGQEAVETAMNFDDYGANVPALWARPQASH